MTYTHVSIKIPIYNDPWLDNGIENLHRTIKKMGIKGVDINLDVDNLTLKILDKNLFLKTFSNAIMRKRQNLIVVSKDKKTQATKEIKKDHLLLQEGKKESGKVAFKENFYRTEKIAKILKKVFEESAGKRKCILCGRPFNKPVKKLQQASYPFVTKIASLSGVRSYRGGIRLSLRDYYDNFCPICYLIGILVWADEGLIYRTFPGEKSFIFLPILRDLKSLNHFKTFCVNAGLLKITERYSNLRVNIYSDEIEYTPGEFSTLLCFYEKFVDISDEMPDEWLILQIPFGTVKNVKPLPVHISEGILAVIKEIKNREKLARIYSDLMKKILFYSPQKNDVDWEVSRMIREKLSKTFLLNDFNAFVTNLLPRRGGYTRFSNDIRKALEELIFVWRWKRMGIPKENLEEIKSVGNIVAKVSKSNASLLYKMDKTRNLNEFWNVLREIARKMPGMEENLRNIKPTALDSLIKLVKDIVGKEKEGWREIRDLLVIYSSISYSLEKMKENKGGNKK